MIAVIADDLTGAAEIGGIALRHSPRVVIDTCVQAAGDADVLVIATDARSKGVEEAKGLIARATKELLALHPHIIFKKTDSLLRGHVAEELVAQLQASGKHRALLVPANPRLKRTIRQGIYYADGVPLHESALADAARKRIAASDVLDLIGADFRNLTSVVSLGDEWPLAGILIGNTGSEADLDEWAKKIDDNTIPAGSGGFFNAVLANRIAVQQQAGQNTMTLGNKVICVCGSAFPLSKAGVAQARTEGRRVAYMPERIFCEGADQSSMLATWVRAIVDAVEKDGRVIMAVADLACSSMPDIGMQVRRMMAAAVEQAMQQTAVDELVIEGGATAASIIEQLRFKRFYPAQELAQGVLRMRVQEAQGLHLTMKPGSYPWPASIWDPA